MVISPVISCVAMVAPAKVVVDGLCYLINNILNNTILFRIFRCIRLPGANLHSVYYHSTDLIFIQGTDYQDSGQLFLRGCQRSGLGKKIVAGLLVRNGAAR